MEVANTVVYYDTTIITGVKRFYSKDPRLYLGVNFLRKKGRNKQ